MIITWLWGHLSAILTRIFLFFAAPMNRNLKPAPKEPLQSIEKSPDGKQISVFPKVSKFFNFLFK